MPSLLLVMLGGAFGAGGRHLLGRAMLGLLGPGYPWGTLLANLIGGFLMGVLVGTLARFGHGSEQIRLLLGVGVLGGFTTFSSFSLETILMFERGAWALGGAYVLVSLLGSLLALVAGLGLMRALA